MYSNAIQENMNALLYPGFIEELVDIVELQDDKIVVSTQAFRPVDLRGKKFRFRVGAEKKKKKRLTGHFQSFFVFFVIFSFNFFLISPEKQ